MFAIEYGKIGLIPLIFLMACAQKPDAQKIVDAAIKVRGGERFEKMVLNFDFRNKHYSAKRNKGIFTYTREFEDSTGYIKDIYTNDGFVRLIDGDTANITEKKAAAYTNSVNSVIYFALLPFGLNDPAVVKEYIGKSIISEKEYYKIMVTFREEGGGKDHEDIFVYWFDTNDYSMDYFSYLYFTDGGGIRFREATNVRTINGITFADYNNYGIESTDYDITQTDSLFLNNKIKLLSNIILENINVEIIK
jgi:hypothetical protein